MRRLIASLPMALLLAACSPAPAPPSADVPAVGSSAGPSTGTATTVGNAPANLALGTAPWYAWVGQTLNISDGKGHGPDPGSNEWIQAVQETLGEEAPQSQPGSPEWQQSVDALLRTRVPAAR
jgi:hypothetical protein